MPPETPPSRLEEIRARCEAATKGPWRGWNAFEMVGPNKGLIAALRIGPPDPGARAGLTASDGCDIHGTRADFEFVFHARDDIPYLLALLAETSAAAYGRGVRDAASLCDEKAKEWVGSYDEFVVAEGWGAEACAEAIRALPPESLPDTTSKEASDGA